MPAKTIAQCQKALSQAISRAYDVRLPWEEIDTTHVGRDVRSFISRHAGRPHTDLKIADVAALSLSRAEKASGDDSLASTLADLIDGGIGLERKALSPQGLAERMARHRAQRARENPLPADQKLKARADAPRVIRRSGASAIRVPEKKPPEPRVSVGSVVRYRRFDEDHDRQVVIGSPAASKDVPDSIRRIPAGSPLALAMRGATRGTIVSVNLAGNPVELEILSVEPT